MTTEQRLERDLPTILGDLASAPYPDYIDDVLATTAQRRQRPAWTFPERWLPMDLVTERVPTARLPWRQLGVLALIALLLATALAVYVGSPPRLPTPFGRAANGFIAYAIDGDIYAGDPVSGGSRVLLADPTYDYDPYYSRDGTRIAFTRRVDPAVDGAAYLVVMDADGTNARAVSSEPFKVITWWDWVPNSESLVVVHEPRGASVFQLLDADGIDPPKTLAEGIQVDGPTFRPPDSAEILFRGETAAGASLYVMNADGTELRELTEPIKFETAGISSLAQSRYSPDGSTIAYQRWDPGAGVMRLYVMDADGGNPRELSAEPGTYYLGWPVWSNDGTRIAAQRGRVQSTGQTGSTVVILDVDKGTVVSTGPNLPYDGAEIEWAPDDSSLLMVPYSDDSRQLLLDPAGGPWTEMPWDSDSYPAWQRKAP